MKVNIHMFIVPAVVIEWQETCNFMGERYKKPVTNRLIGLRTIMEVVTKRNIPERLPTDEFQPSSL